ncbi:MAG: neutral/alkaline non-lysosomal ceramidase N-terminal domain-containing protein [Gemmataceae bacterium]|nr:neutral/alkaline non-lysosomal ceramidase N-terminal domain-containing protein [Gemmataceae bacterium]
MKSALLPWAIAMVLSALPVPWLGERGGGQTPAQFRIGFGAHDITPALGKKPVYLAGFGKNRLAKGIHDPLMARAIVLADGDKKIALASVDLVGLFFPVVEKIRGRLPGYAYVGVSSTHNHQGPDTLGLWGPNLFQSGVDPAYLKQVEDGVIAAVEQADRDLRGATAKIGLVQAPELLRDSREPQVKHDDLVVLQFDGVDGKKRGLVVQWNNHPEDLGDKNTQITGDLVWSTVAYLQEKHGCPVVYFTGTVGGLMTTLGMEIKDERGTPLKTGDFARTRRYGQLVGQAAEKALAQAKPVVLTPFLIQRRAIFLPLDNQFYLLARKLGVMEREAFRWNGDVWHAEPTTELKENQQLCLKTEIGRLRLGEVDVALIPGEIYPELVLGKVQDPPDPGADFPDAPIEPAIYAQLTAKYKMILGLANDEIGYIIPKRQWDVRAPFCYGRKRAQYGEENSVGPETAPLLCAAFRALAKGQ